MKGRESAVGKVKDILRKAARDGLWMALSLLPKDENKAVCQSYYGRGYSDSPKAIADELLSRGWKVYWTVKGEAEAATLPPGVTPLRLESPRAIYHPQVGLHPKAGQHLLCADLARLPLKAH